MAAKAILLGLGAEDAESLAMAMNVLSNKEKFRILVAHEGSDAVQGIMQEMPDMAILDINLAGKGGDECCKQVKRANLSPATIVVLLISLDTDGDIGRCVAASCDAILVKPLTYHSLSGLVTRLLFRERKVPSRYPVRLPVRYGIQPHEQTGNYSVDLTTTGIFLQAEEVMPVDTPLQLAFTLPHGGATIECTARVAWLNDPMLRHESTLPPGMGLEFLDIDKSQVDAIRNFLYS